MKKKNIAIMIFVLMVLVFGLSVLAESSNNIISYTEVEEQYSTLNEKIELPYLKIANDITIAGNINKIGAALSNKIDIKGTLTKPIFAIGKEVNIDGNIEYGYIFASTVNVRGKVSNDVIICAQTINIYEGATLASDVIVASEDLKMNGTIEGNLIGSVNNVDLNGNIKGDFRIKAGNVNFQDELVQGKIYLESDKMISIPSKYPDAKMNVVYVESPDKTTNVWNVVYLAIFTSVLYTCLYYLIKAIDKTKMIKLKEKVSKNMSFATISGLIMLFLLPVELLLFIVFAVFAWPVVLPIFILYVAIIIAIMMLATFITGSVVYEIVKDKVLKPENKYNKLLSILLMAFIYLIIYGLCKLKYVGGYVSFINIVFAMGIIWTDIFKRTIKVEENKAE